MNNLNLKPRSLLIYARTKTGKTTNLKLLAKYFIEKHKMKIRYISSDGGGYRPFFDSDNLIGKGYVDIFDNTDRELALQDIHRLGEGLWPDKTGLLDRDRNWNTPTGAVNKEYRKKVFQREQIGAYFIEGIESIGNLLVTHFSDQLTGQSVGFKPGWVYQEGDYAVAGLEPGHIGVIQNELRKLVIKKFCQLPVKLIVFTSKVKLGQEVTSKTKKSGEKFATASGEPIYGPSAPGTALVSDIPSWFESCLYLDTFKGFRKEGDKKVEIDGRRAWYRTHTEKIIIEGVPTDVPFLAGSSCPAERYEEMDSKFGGNGFFQLGFKRGIDKYIEFLESIEEVTT